MNCNEVPVARTCPAAAHSLLIPSASINTDSGKQADCTERGEREVRLNVNFFSSYFSLIKPIHDPFKEATEEWNS